MKNILDKNKLIKLYESYKLNNGQVVWIHHPITEDLVKVLVKSVSKDSIVITPTTDSPYLGQPDITIKKHLIIGIA